MSIPPPKEPSQKWWKEVVIYQIYPISFFDSNGDGFGDLNGIITKLDYLKHLGVDVIWLSPIYKSPLADMGYDISDYYTIDPRYGTLEDWDHLLEAAHSRGMKIIMDLVVNHTSDQHEWFTQSRSSNSTSNPKRDWYIWRPPKYDPDGTRRPPNNWLNRRKEPAWEYDPHTNEYYLHLYLPQQPDLNWENPAVREAVYELMRFWLDRGCDGFRMDVINLISKTPGLPDAPIVDSTKELQPARMHYANGPRVHEFIQEMRQQVLNNYNIMSVGEMPIIDSPSQLASYVIPTGRELDMAFQFEIFNFKLGSQKASTGTGTGGKTKTKWRLPEFKKVVTFWQGFKRDEGFWNSIFLENHDKARSVSRFGNTTTPTLQSLSAKLLATFEATQCGTLYIYQGEELGLKNFPVEWGIEEYRDVSSLRIYERILKERQVQTGKPASEIDMHDVLQRFQTIARDHTRVPMQWTPSPNAGFTTGTPWMRVNSDYKTWNAERELADPGSVFHFWKKAVKMRRENRAFVYGDFTDLSPDHAQIFAYRRTWRDGTHEKSKLFQQALVLLNFTDRKATISIALDSVFTRTGCTDGIPRLTLVLGNYDDVPGVLEGDGVVTLRKYESRVYLVGCE